MKKLSTCLGIGVVTASMAVAAPASAAAKYDPASGTGYVSKGEVQSALGWNNKEFQANADRVSFSVQTYQYLRMAWTCTEDGGDGTLEREGFRDNYRYGWIDTTPRERGQVVGFELSDYQYIVGISVPAGESETGVCPESWTASGVRLAEVEEEEITLDLHLDGENTITATLET
ncbi:hypothetical protein [Kocuria kalidii]|uniref:hypothetical protein n=1 Tax=Kocuria kalidii TaxID=3376283 RepID=UPI0037B2AD9D